MNKSSHGFIALSGHGFGHLAQVAPVVNEWRRRHPQGRLTIQSTLSESVLRARIHGEFDLIPVAADFGMLMVDALDAKVEESLAAYRDFHGSWEQRLEAQEEILRAATPDFVLANIPYLTLAAADRLRIPAVALCSLNWADILTGCCDGRPEVSDLTAVMLAAYNSATVFLQPTPCMPMPALLNGCLIGPIAELGQNRRPIINRRLGLRGDETLVLFALGGFNMRPPLERWPTIPGVIWLTPPEWETNRIDMPGWAMPEDGSMVDLIRSTDVLFTKPGYGAFTEAVCNGRRVLFVGRDQWPEEPWLSRWLLNQGNAIKISRQQLVNGELAETLLELRAQPGKPPVQPYGVTEAADWLDRLTS